MAKITPGQFMAVFFTPFLIVAGLPIIVAFHQFMEEILQSFVGDAQLPIISFLVTFLSLAAFIGLMIYVYRFVKTGGEGLFEV